MSTKRFIIWLVSLFSLLLFSGCAELKPDPAYGAYPANYKEIVSKWLDTFLAHPEAVKNVSASKPMAFKTQERTYCYSVIVRFTAKTDDGSFTPEQSVMLSIRDGAIIDRLGPMPSTKFHYFRLPPETIRSRTAR